MKIFKSLPILILSFTLILMIASCTQTPHEVKEEIYQKTKTVMYTNVSITLSAPSKEKAELAMDAAFGEIKKLETLLSFWTDDSEIAAINKAAGSAPVKVSPETLEIVQRALFISQETGGAFDGTIGPVIKQWDFKKQKMPEGEALSEAMKLVNYKVIKTDIDNSTVFLSNPKMSFDTGGIAKGYAADKAISKLKELGIQAALVAVAGDIRGYGKRSGDKPWRVGIKNPRSDDPADIIASIELNDEAVSTSGDYERFFIRDGKRYHHILDPKTGYPATGTMSATVIAPKAVLTDGLSTGVFIMRPKEGIKLLEQLGLDGIIIDTNGKTHLTSNIKHRIQWLDNEFKPQD